MKVVSIDSGSSYLKLFSISEQNEVTLLEPSLVEEVGEKSQLSSRIQVDGKWYVAGRVAELQKTSYQEEPEIGEFHGKQSQFVQWMHAFEKNNITGNYDILITSLPYDDFTDINLRKMIKDKKEFVWTNSLNEKRWVQFNSVEIVPQGVGALELYKKERNGDLPEELTLVDIGSCTTDVVSVIFDEEQGQYVYKEKGCTSIKDISTSVFIRTLRDKINEKRPVKVRIGYHELTKAILKQKFEIQVGSETIKFQEHYENIRKEFTEDLSNKLQFLLGDSWRSTNNTILTGGGALFVLPWSCEKRTARMDIFANVRGQYLMII